MLDSEEYEVQSSIFEQNVSPKNKHFKSWNLSPSTVNFAIDFIEQYQNQTLSDLHSQRLQYVAEVLSEKTDDATITWFPAHRCALIAKRNTSCLRGNERNLFLLGLSNYDMQLQHEWCNQAIQTGSFSSFNVIPMNPVSEDKFKLFMDIFGEEFGKIYVEDTKLRIGRHKKMSPAFIEFALNRTHRRLNNDANDPSEPLRGGWSEVLNYTGGDWPLLSAVIEYLPTLAPCDYDDSAHSQHQHFVCHLMMNILETTMKESVPIIQNLSIQNNIVTQCINKIMIMIECISRKAVDEISGVYPIDDVEQLLRQCREELDFHVRKRFQDRAKKFQLPSGSLPHKRWSISIAKEEQEVQPKAKDEVWKLALSNLGIFPVIRPAIFQTIDAKAVLDFVHTLGRFEVNETRDTLPIGLVRSTIEHFFFEMSQTLKKPNFSVCEASIESLVNEYREFNRKYLSHFNKSSGLVVELLSNELLVMWIGFALVHKSMARREPLLRKYGIPLDWQHLSVLVLSDKDAQNAAIELSVYLRNNIKRESEIFNLSGDQQATFEFALEYAQQSEELLRIWEEEHEAAEKRECEQWIKICAKKDQVLELEKLINKLIEEQTELEKNLKSIENGKFSTYAEFYRQINFVKSQIEKVKRNQQSSKHGLSKAKEAPSPVFQPLPRKKEEALRVLFFLHMPSDVQRLARLAISAQQCLFPSKDFREYTAANEKRWSSSVEDHLRVEKSSTSWAEYYNSQAPSTEGSNEVLHLFSKCVPAKKGHVGPADVTELTSSSQSVWHPNFDVMGHPIILWNGGEFHLDSRDKMFFNPFKPINECLIVDNFTERIDENIKFTLTQYEKHTAATRSNEAIAKQKNKPDCMNKFQWFTFASLRAYPNQQLRKLCCALNERSLPFSKPVVHTLVRQVLYHIGKLQDSGQDIEPLWKTDLSKGDFLDVISEELRSLSSEISQKPSELGTMVILIDITRYLAQWSDQCVSVLRSLLTILENWILDCEKLLKSENLNRISTLRIKMAIFYNLAILCFSRGDITDDDLGKLVRFIFQAENKTKLTSHNEENKIWTDQLAIVKTMRHQFMACRINEVVAKLQKPELTLCLTKAVQSLIANVPLNLKWYLIQYESGDLCSCFEASCETGDSFHVNVMNGIVLCNGLPPSHLPNSILKHPLYERTFGNENFETRSIGKHLQTVTEIDGCLYSFSLNNNSLTVTETCMKSSKKWKLLDALSLSQTSWGFDLPDILKNNFSHWFCEEQNVIFFRGIHFTDKCVDYVLKKDIDWHCYRIPSHRRISFLHDCIKKEWISELSLLDKLVKLEGPILNVLKKFESASYIHCYLAENSMICYHYPRFNLEFYSEPSNDKKIYSRDYSEYQLETCQQLEDTLLGFERYLIIRHNKRGSEDIKIIIPIGQVSVDESGVEIRTEESPKSVLKVYTYDVHPRFKTLIATSIPARIHLADLYAACSTLLPEPRMKMCGSEVAMQLIRRSWTNQPLEQTDYQKLKEMCRHTNFTPGLELLCHEVACSSLQIDFMHTSFYETNLHNKSKLLAFPKQASVAYLQERSPFKIRSSLSATEETRVLGGKKPIRTKRCFCQKDVLIQLPKIAEINCLEDTIESDEKCLLQQIITEPNQSDDSNLPVSIEMTTNLHVEMLKDLQQSFDAYLHQKCEKLNSGFEKEVLDLYTKIAKKRADAEDWILQFVHDVPKTCGPESTKFRLLRYANIYPLLTLEDVIKFVLEEGWIKHFNPFLSVEIFECLRTIVLTWMKCCVLEDRLSRLVTLVEQYKDGNSSFETMQLHVIRELSVFRQWSANDHPQWLAFEVINRLQIRPIQYIVAMSIINGIQTNSKGPITQLNMGEGKTRVILPMLAMYWKNAKCLVRINILSALLQEAGEYLHSVLSATLLNISIINFPFNREVTLHSESVNVLISVLESGIKSGAVVLCAPEHRMSLKLKLQEANYEVGYGRSDDELTQVVEALQNINSMEFVDILDEVDEIIRTSNKLVYAFGSQEQLPSRDSRVNVLQGFLKVVATNETVQALSSSFLAQELELESDGNFPDFRIVPGKKFDKIESIFQTCLIKRLLSDPPYNMKWLKGLNSDTQRRIQEIVTDPSVSTFDLEILTPSQVDQVLAMRGFIANGLFVHCLTKRNRVDYGINRLGGKKKMMAVPFRACETPSLRAEFGHPDCALMYTCLSYYYDGLDFKQLLEAFTELISLGRNAQKRTYEDWYKAMRTGLTAEDESSIDDVAKLDITNSALVSRLFKVFRRSVNVINFWLNHCVFPKETKKFPCRLEATAWDLASNQSQLVAGFSGTNDEKFLVPSSLTWVTHSESSLVATDGKMLNLLQKSTFEVLKNYNFQGTWQFILDSVVEKTKRTQKDVYVHSLMPVHKWQEQETIYR